MIRDFPIPLKPALNEDVLHCVFSYLLACDFPSTALTCRLWAGPSNRWLYSTITISDQDAESQMKMRRLASTLRYRERLRRLIRTLRVVYEGHSVYNHSINGPSSSPHIKYTRWQSPFAQRVMNTRSFSRLFRDVQLFQQSDTLPSMELA